MGSIKKWFAQIDPGTLMIVSFAIALRLLLLGIKPPHFDEGVNGWFMDEMKRQGFYHYDPSNYHGPLHFYVLFIFHTLFGRHIWALRLPIVLVSGATVYLVTLFERFWGRRSCQIAALAMAVSPAAVFYARYGIHESWLVLFLVLTLFGLAGLKRFGTRPYLWAVGMGVTGMILTKETYVIHIACFALAGLCAWIYEKVSRSVAVPRAHISCTTDDLVKVIGVGLLLIVFFYSGTFLDFSSLRGIVTTFDRWIHTGTEGAGHEKPPYYWLELMLRYEWPALIGLVYSLRYLWPRCDGLMRYTAVYGVGALTAYSIVHYKTPWCIVSLIWPFFFTFADAVSEIGRETSRKLVIAALSLLLAASFIYTVRLNFFHYTNEKEKYVYVQTYDDIYKFVNPLYTLAAQDPANFHLDGNILLESYHPLPWMLGDFTNIGYYDEAAPENPDADFLIVDDDRKAAVEKKLTGTYFTERIHLRDAQEPATIYYNAITFSGHFPNREPEFTPATRR
jgi:uncharacterized protein (TIGR03663 family)